jgi:uncharacterized protein YicC (UPF0701 family)
MDGNELSKVIIAAIVMSGVLVGVLAQAWVKVRSSRRPSNERLAPGIEQRLERMEQAIESVAVEVERISEAHRFTAKLLAERGGEVPRQPERVITPR